VYVELHKFPKTIPSGGNAFQYLIVRERRAELADAAVPEEELRDAGVLILRPEDTPVTAVADDYILSLGDRRDAVPGKE
jgi:hypothetical protein